LYQQIKAPTTRKLRRRPNDPVNVNSSSGPSDKRRKLAPAQLAYLLDENDVVDDLRAIERGASGAAPTKTSAGGNGPSTVRGTNNGISNRRSNYSSPARQSDQSPSR
jgi:Sin3 histone deacetylase corepressor complex component SDS3